MTVSSSKHFDSPSSVHVSDPAVIYAGLERCLMSVTGKSPDRATSRDWFLATAMLAREMLAPLWAASRQVLDAWHTKRV